MENSEELWMPITGYEELYHVSTAGRVKQLQKMDTVGRLRKEKFMQYSVTTKGYLRVGLSKDSIRKFFQVHRLVAAAFLCNEYQKPEVNHKNGLKNDNRVGNLEWSTTSENQLHATKSGLSPTKENHPHFKGAITVYTKEGILIDTLIGVLDMREKGYNPSSVYACVKGSRATHKNLIFRREE